MLDAQEEEIFRLIKMCIFYNNTQASSKKLLKLTFVIYVYCIIDTPYYKYFDEKNGENININKEHNIKKRRNISFLSHTQKVNYL